MFLDICPTYVGQTLENLFDEKEMYPYHHREMFGRHMSDIYVQENMSDIYPSLVFTSGVIVR